MILVLGGTGAYFLDLEAEVGPGVYQKIATPYGEAGSIYVPERWDGALGLASRHGWGQLQVSPPFVNSRALIWAARELGVTHMLSWNGVGAIHPLLQVHDLLVLDGVIDVTKTRAHSFAEQPASRPFGLPEVVKPFDPPARAALYATARREQARAFAVGVYACSEGPRLETQAEIAALARFGAEVVGMTLVPEVVLAAEFKLAFAALAYVTNFAAGVEPGPGAPRFFGVEVARRCLSIMLATATTLLPSVAVENQG